MGKEVIFNGELEPVFTETLRIKGKRQTLEYITVHQYDVTYNANGLKNLTCSTSEYDYINRYKNNPEVEVINIERVTNNYKVYINDPHVKYHGILESAD